MQRGDGGTIVNIGSVSANRPAPTAAAYGAAKAGLAAFTATAGQEWAPKVRVNCVTAGLIRTDQADLHYGDEESIAKVEQTIPIGRMASPSDIADACVYFASPLASYVTGANLIAARRRRPPRLPRGAQGCWELTLTISPVMYDA